MYAHAHAMPCTHARTHARTEAGGDVGTAGDASSSAGGRSVVQLAFCASVHTPRTLFLPLQHQHSDPATATARRCGIDAASAALTSMTVTSVGTASTITMVHRCTVSTGASFPRSCSQHSAITDSASDSLGAKVGRCARAVSACSDNVFDASTFEAIVELASQPDPETDAEPASRLQLPNSQLRVQRLEPLSARHWLSQDREAFRMQLGVRIEWWRRHRRLPPEAPHS